MNQAGTAKLAVEFGIDAGQVRRIQVDLVFLTAVDFSIRFDGFAMSHGSISYGTAIHSWRRERGASIWLQPVACPTDRGYTMRIN
jgi:hypothetical protein